MRAAVLYDSERLSKNGFFADALCENLKKHGVDASVVLTDQAEKLDADFVIRRCEALKEAKELEKRGVRVFNNAFVSEICNDKWQTYLFLRKNGLPVCETFLPEDFSPAFPCVVKARSGHGGGQVVLCENEKEYSDALALCGKAIVQPYISCGGTDVRLYVLGGRVLYAVRRSGNGDFRSNFTLGGKAERISPDEKMVILAEKAARLSDADFVGVDLMCENGKYIINEIEDVVGTRMLYSLKLCDAADILASYAVKTMKT